MKMLRAFAMCSVIVLTGCTTLGSVVSTISDNITSSTPSQVETLAAAEQAATLVTNAVDVYVKNGNANRAVLVELQALSNGVHAALVSLETTQKNGGSLVYGGFNAALDAFSAYSTKTGVSH